MELRGAEALKREAARAALEQVESGMALGLGTGSTVAHFLDLLGEALACGALQRVVGVPTSVQTERHAGSLGIPLAELSDRPRLDLCVDGADEVDSALDLIKGMGGALLREKMVAQASDRLVIIGDEGKLVSRLGTVSPLPVEVVAWGWPVHVAFLEARGASVSVRRCDDGSIYESDNGNVILDCGFEQGIADAPALDAALKARAGVVETGLFLGMAAQAIVAGAEGVQVMEAGA